MEARCAFAGREGLALSTQFFAAITYGHHTSIHIPPSERKDKKDRGGMNSEQYCRLAYLGPGGLDGGAR